MINRKITSHITFPKVPLRGHRWSYYRNIKNQIIPLLDTAVTDLTPGGYVRLYRRNNQEIFRLLDQMDFFFFHDTNQGHVCLLHQINLYMKIGWRFYKQGQYCRDGEREIHHLDNDPLNNHPSNLIYISPYENKVLSQKIRYSKRYLGNITQIPKELSKQFSKFWQWTYEATSKRFKKIAEDYENLNSTVKQPFNYFAFHDPLPNPYFG